MVLILKNQPQIPLPTDNDPEKHWKGMPDFKQEKQAPYAMFNLRVRNADDLAKLEKLLGQKLTPKTKSAWYPKLENDGHGMKRWV